MVSNILYNSFKDLDMRGRVPFAAILLVVLIFVVVALDPATVLFTGFLVLRVVGSGLGSVPKVARVPRGQSA